MQKSPAASINFAFIPLIFGSLGDRVVRR